MGQYRITFTTKEGQQGELVFPAVSELMARAWYEMCVRDNQWTNHNMEQTNE